MLDEHGFGHHGTGAAGTGEPGDRRQQMQKKDGQIAHRSILARSRSAQELLTNFGIRHAQGSAHATIRRAVSESINRVIPLKNMLRPTSVPSTDAALDGHVLPIITASTRVTTPSNSNHPAPGAPKSEGQDEFQYALDNQIERDRERQRCQPSDRTSHHVEANRAVGQSQQNFQSPPPRGWDARQRPREAPR